jgi:hypothetical protein
MGDARDATGQRPGRSLTDTRADASAGTPPRVPAGETATPTGRSHLHAMSDRSIALALTLGTLLVIVLLRLPYLLEFAPQGEDIASLLYASRFGDPSLIRWLTEGTRHYYVEYPELGLGNDFIRPVVDGSVWLNSLIAPTWHSGMMLAVNFAGHAACVGLVYLVSRRIIKLGRTGALVAAVLFAGTISVWSVLTFLSYRGDMMVALFTLPALLIVRDGRGWRGVAAMGLVLLALFSKEAGVAAPFMVGLLVAYRALQQLPPGARWRLANVRHLVPAALVAGIPALVYAGVMLTRDFQDNHAVRDAASSTMFGLTTAVLNPIRFGITAFFPVEPSVLKAALGAGGPTDVVDWVGAVHAPIAVAVTLLAWVVIAVAMLHRSARTRLWLPMLLALTASMLPIVIKADPRYMYLGQALLLPLLVLAAGELRRRYHRLRSRAVTVVALAALLAAGPLYLVADLLTTNAEMTRENGLARQIVEVASAEARRPEVGALYIVNTPVFATPGLPILRFAALRAGRPDLPVRVVNSLSRWDGVDTTGEEGVTVARVGEGLDIDIRIGGEERFFSYLDPATAAALGQPDMIEYGGIDAFAENSVGKSEVAATHLDVTIPSDEAVLIGMDPGERGVFVYRSYEASPRWRPITDGQGS